MSNYLWNFGVILLCTFDAKIRESFEVSTTPSWICINIECQRTRNPLSLILNISVVKGRGVLKSEYYVEEDPV